MLAPSDVGVVSSYDFLILNLEVTRLDQKQRDQYLITLIRVPSNSVHKLSKR